MFAERSGSKWEVGQSWKVDLGVLAAVTETRIEAQELGNRERWAVSGDGLTEKVVCSSGERERWVCTRKEMDTRRCQHLKARR
jgi:hypothetical protein